MAINGTMLSVLKGVGAVLPPAAMLGILGFMGNGIVQNDRRNTDQHIKIRSEMVAGDTIVREKVSDVKDIVTDIRVEQKVITEVLKRIEAK